jgi:hypothetical protein
MAIHIGAVHSMYLSEIHTFLVHSVLTLLSSQTEVLLVVIFGQSYVELSVISLLNNLTVSSYAGAQVKGHVYGSYFSTHVQGKSQNFTDFSHFPAQYCGKIYSTYL